MPVTDWTQTPDGFRRWKRGCGARWRVRDGVLEAFDIEGRPIVTTSADVAERTRRAARWLPGMLAAGATRAEARALLALAAIESAGRDLPVFGDYRTPSNPKESVPASTPDSRPLSVGIYQFTKGTAADLDASWGQLATSEAANHRAALKHLRGTASRHGGDFMTTAAIWNAGSVMRSRDNDVWCVVSWSPSTLTKYAAAYNAARAFLPASPQLEDVARPPDRPFTPVVEPDSGIPWGVLLSVGALAFVIATGRKGISA